MDTAHVQRWLLPAPARCEACAGLCWVMTLGGPDACLLCYRRIELQYNPRPRACIEPDCGVIYKPTNPNQWRCHDHVKPRHVSPMVLADKPCKLCERMFTPSNGRALYCCEGCKRTAEVKAGEAKRRQRYGLRACLECGVQFTPRNDHNRRCPECSTFVAPLKPVPVATSLPCWRCRHGARSQVAELGVECTAGLWLRCRPLADASQFAAKGEG
jgi:hypothetical protein